PSSHYVAYGVIYLTAVVGAAVASDIYARRVPVPAALQPVRRAMGEGLFIERAYRLGAVAVLLPASRAMGWVETHVVDGAMDLIAESAAFAGEPRNWLAQVRIRQLMIGLFDGIVELCAAR